VVNELRRPTDRVEDVLAWTLTAGVLLLLVCAGLVGAAGYRAEMAHSHDVVTGGAATAARPASAINRSTAGVVRAVPAPGEHREWPLVGGGSMAGVGVGIWVDGNGRAAPPPPGSGRALMAGAASSAAVVAVGGTLLYGFWWVVRRAFSARNLRQWEREWEQLGPRWSRGPR
jgi:hypothetical protein